MQNDMQQGPLKKKNILVKQEEKNLIFSFFKTVT
jgi:hypothetical protein